MSGVSAKEYSCAHGAQINFEDLAPYLTYASSLTIRKIEKYNTCSTGTYTVQQKLVGLIPIYLLPQQDKRQEGMDLQSSLPGRTQERVVEKWSNLPEEVRAVPSIAAFRNMMKNP